MRFAPTLTQRAFQRCVREFGSLSAFEQVAPPGTLGTGRVRLGADGVYTREASAAVALRREAILAPHLFGGVAF